MSLSEDSFGEYIKKVLAGHLKIDALFNDGGNSFEF